MSARVRVPEAPRPGEDLRDAIAVFVVLLVGLAAGWLLKSSVEARAVAFASPVGNVTLAYPATWVQGANDAENMLLSVYDDSALSGWQPTFRLATTALPGDDPSLAAAATALVFAHGRDLSDYRHLATEETTLAGLPAIRLDYGFVADPPTGVGQAGLPVVVHGTDFLVQRNGQVVVFTLLADASGEESDLRVFDRILNSVRFS